MICLVAPTSTERLSRTDCGGYETECDRAAGAPTRHVQCGATNRTIVT